MNLPSKDSTSRVENLRETIRHRKSGGFTKYAAKLMAKPLGGMPVECTLIGHCHTFIFEFPRSEVFSESLVKPGVIFDDAGLKAAIVTDIPSYFEQTDSNSPHFTIDVSLRDGVRRTHGKSLEDAERFDKFAKELFLIVEEYSEFTPTKLADEQCFSIDEVRDGEAVIEGGRQGERALLAFPAMDCPWPEFQFDMRKINVILAAVKSAQGAIGHIRKHFDCSCYVSSNAEAVYTLNLTMSAAVGVVSRLAAEDLEERVKRIESMVTGMMSDAEPIAAEVFDSLVLDKSTDDEYQRLAYLRMWQAVEDARRHLGMPELLNERQAIGGSRAPVELKKYRNAIAHWHTGRIDQSYLGDLQRLAMELIRRKYAPNLD